MTNQRLQIIALSLIFAVITLVVAFMWWPFLKLVVLAFIMAILFMPLYKRLAARFTNEPLAAILTIILVLLIFIVPLYLVGQLLFNELVGLYNQYRSGGFSISSTELIQNLPQQIQDPVTNLLQDFTGKLTDFAGNAFEGVTSVLSNVAGFFLSFFLVFFSLYYFLRDWDKLKSYFNSIFPLSSQHENLLIAKLEGAVNGVVKGMFSVALVQGLVATLGFLIFGVPQPFLWGAFTVIAALVPTVGTSISLVPAVLYLLITGNIGAGIGLAIWGAVAVGTIDNILSPKLVGARAKLHPLLVIFSVLGGIQLFGFIGFLLGPIITAVFVTLLDIYRTDLKEYLSK